MKFQAATSLTNPLADFDDKPQEGRGQMLDIAEVQHHMLTSGLVNQGHCLFFKLLDALRIEDVLIVKGDKGNILAVLNK